MLPAPWTTGRSCSCPTPACSAAPSACCSTAPPGSAGRRCVACPEGPLAAAARGAGLRGRADPRPLAAAARARASARAAGSAGSRSTPRGSPAATGPPRWWPGARAPCSPPRPRRSPARRWLAVHHDLLPERRRGRRRARREPPRRRRRGDLATRSRATCGAARATILHPGVDLAAWPRAAAAPTGPPRALVLGALVPWKRADLALEIAARIPELRLELAGAPLPGDDDGFAAGLRDRAARRDLRRPRDVLRRARRPARRRSPAPHLLLHCADAEPFGMALLEALASGPPGRRARRRRAAGDRRRTAPGGSTRPATRTPARRPCAPLLADAAAPAAARARAERFPVEASAARLRRRRRGGRAVTAVHDRRRPARLRARSWRRCCRRCERHAPERPARRRRHGLARRRARARPRATAPSWSSCPDNPGFGAANNAGVARARHDVTVLLNPDTELVDDSLHELAALARIHPRALHAPRLLEPDGSVQRSAHPLPGHRRRAAARARAPAAAPARAARARRAVPRRARRARSAGRSPRAWPPRPRCCASSARSTPPCTCSPRTWSSACAPAPAASRPSCTRSCACATPAATSSCATASRSRCSPAAAARRSRRTLGPRARALDDAAQLVTFATRIAARAALRPRRRPRARRSSAALRREIGS